MAFKKPKVQMCRDREVWSWTKNVTPEEITTEHIRSVYRLNTEKCEFGKCRRNCQTKPFCVSGIGGGKLTSVSPAKEISDDETDYGQRKPGTLVGLKNLGATCYINSLLQLWFHNISFRNAILTYKSESSGENEGNQNGDLVLKSGIDHLQFLFVLMQFGRNRSVDPTDFIKSLGIETSTQQDAHEFSQLFLSYLEDYLSKQADPGVRNVVNNNFQGEYSYNTRCSNCQTESVRPSKFYQLELSVKSSTCLDESLKDFLKEERLEGADMYSCGVCGGKQEATRRIVLNSLPSVLHLQLMRFMYDRQKGEKKKLNTSFQFPERLDMKQYLSVDDSESCIYNLTAVLIHKGSTAYQGHYIAHVRDQTSGHWYKFSDDVAEKMEGKELTLNSTSQTKNSKTKDDNKGSLSSSNAYMLVYTQKDKYENVKPLTENELHPSLLQQLHVLNAVFDSLISSSKEQKKAQLEADNAVREEMSACMTLLPVKDQWEAISMNWLMNWVKGESNPIANSDITCRHEKLKPDDVPRYKFINKDAADVLFSKFGGGPRLGEESLCEQCVKEKCFYIRETTKLLDDQKEITSILKNTTDSEDMFWVGINSFRRWRQIYLSSKFDSGLKEESEERLNEEDVIRDGIEMFSPFDVFSDGQKPERLEMNGSEEEYIKHNGKESNIDDFDAIKFNEDVMCFHGNLVVGKKKEVPKEVWEIFRSYFPNCPEFTSDTEQCSECENLASREHEASLELRSKASEEKRLLANLFRGKMRPSVSQQPVHIVSLENFIRPWRNFIRSPGQAERPTSLQNSGLVCEHGNLLQDISATETFEKFVRLTDEEWCLLTDKYGQDQEITVSLNSEGIMSSQPGVCGPCLAERLEEQEKARLTYTDAPVYIRLIEESEPAVVSQSLQGKGMKRKNQDLGSLRRSSRIAFKRKGHLFSISSQQTLLDLKLQICESPMFGVLPFDQKLFLEGDVELSDHDAKLPSLKVFPNSVIYLQIVERTEETEDEKKRKIETEYGFKGTGLMKS